jgi:hypothetical protein
MRMASPIRRRIGIAFLLCAFLHLPIQGTISTALAQGEASFRVDPLAATTMFLGENRISVKVPGTCNSNAFAQIAAHPDYFLGRRGSNGGTCADFDPESLALFKMDWRTYTLNFERYVLKPPLEVSAGNEPVMVRSIYDPSVALYNGELWVAFECAAPRFIGASACIGPFELDSGGIDPSRMTLVISAGSADPTSAYSYTAAVPNLITFNNRLYVYWSAIELHKATRHWERIAIRGVELVEETSGLRRVWASGSRGSAVASHDPSRNVEVLGPNPADAYSDQAADLKGAYAADGHVYLIASVGGRGPQRTEACTTAKGTSYGCFRMQVFRASVPLGGNVFTSRLVAPDGTLKIIGEFFNSPAGFTYPPNTLHLESPQALIIYPFDVTSFQFSGVREQMAPTPLGEQR